MVLDKGYIQIYTGDGKGKTTAALGLALRAAGRGLTVCMIQFLKSAESGELTAAERLAPNLRIFRFSKKRDFFWRLNEAEKEEVRLETLEALDFARALVQRRECDILILDEVLGALHNKLLYPEDLLALLDHKPDGLEIVLTGRSAPPEVLERADLITEMKEIRHYYRQGVPARDGIEK